MNWYVPDNFDDALDALSSSRPPTILAGGTDLYPATSSNRLTTPVLDVTNLPEMGEVTCNEDGCRIGAGATWSTILETSLPPAFEALRAAALQIGGRQIQNQGTIGGNICNASPAADGIPPLLILDARVELISRSGIRTPRLEDFLLAPRRTDLNPAELVSAVLIPKRTICGRSRFFKLGARKHLVISIAMVATKLTVQNGVILEASISIGACSPVATRLRHLEEKLIGLGSTQDVINVISEEAISLAIAPIDDVRADRNYRAHAAAEIVRRSVIDLLEISR